MYKTRSFLYSLLLLALFGTSAFAQSRRVNGRVTMEGSNEPLASASISVAGTTLGTYTDEQGRFTLTVPAGPATLRIRRIGYTQRNIEVPAGTSEVAASLTRDVLQLETQVVTGTATTVSSINAANAVTVISTEKLNRVPTQTLDNALQGKVPGATITQNSGAPGGGVQIQLRGVSSINASFGPLYVIDGVIVDNSSIANGITAITQSARSNFPSAQDQRVNRSADINPNDIENIQILKGPSASSIYGSRGTNGVIIITTKQGRAGKTSLDISQRFGTAAISNKLGLRCFGSAAEVQAEVDAGHIDEATGVAEFNAATDKCHDYEQEFYGENPFNYQTIASVRGASNAGTTFFVSGLVQHDGGLVRNDFYNKQSLRANLGQQFGTRLTLRANTELIHSLTQRGISGNDNTGINPYTTFSGTPSFIELRRNADGTFPKNPSTFVGNNNPFQNAEVIKTPENVYRLIGSASGEYSLFARERQSLDFSLRGGVDSYSFQAKVISPATAFIEQVNALPGTIVNSQANVLSANLGGTLTHRMITNAFTATTSAGFGQSRRNSDVVANTGRGVFPGVTNVSAATQIFTTEGQGINKFFSLFAQEEFLTLGERLFITAGVNAERSSNNGDARKMYAYPKFSASYRVPFIPTQIDELKLRLAYGRAGNQPQGGKYTFLSTLIEEGVSGFRASTVKGFPEIKPETASEIEGGLDLTSFGGRLRLSATQFRKQIDNLILQASIAPSTGFTSQSINGGQIVTHGTELELGMTPIQMERFSWVSNTTYASNKGKVTRLPVPPFIPISGSFGSRFGNAFVQQGQLVTVLQAINGCKALSSTGSCASANRILTFVGNSAPDYQMGFSNDFTFGPIRLASLVDWRKGGLGINLTNAYFDGGLGPDTAVGNARANSFRAGNAAYVEPSGFVKLRELTVGFELPAGLTSGMFNGRAQSARIELSGRNLATWTKYTGLDPEVSNFGNQPLGRFQDVTPYPPSRLFYLTINTTF